MKGNLLFFILLVVFDAYSQNIIPSLNCKIEHFNEKHNLFSKSVLNLKIDKKNQLWVLVNGRVQYFNGENFEYLNNLTETFNNFVDLDTCFVTSSKQNTLPKILNIHERKVESIFTPIDRPEDILVIFENISLLQQSKRQAFNFDPIGKRIIEIKNLNNDIIIDENGYIFPDKSIKIGNYCTGTQKLLLNDVHPSLRNYSRLDNTIFYINNKLKLCSINISNRQKLQVDLELKNPSFPIIIKAVRNSRNEIIIAVSKQIFVLSTQLIPLYEVKTLKNEFPIDRSTITSMAIDSFDNLYIGTLTEGMFKVYMNAQHIKTYSDNPFGKGKFVKCVLPDKKNNRVLVGTWEDGLFIYDTLGVLIEHIKKFPKVKDIPIIAYIAKMTDDEYILFNGISNNYHILKYKNNIPRLTFHTTDIYFEFNFDEYLVSKDSSLMATSKSFFLLDKRAKTLKSLPFNTFYKSIEGSDDLLYMGSEDGIIIIDSKKYKLVKEIKLGVRDVTKILFKDKHSLYLCTTQGLFLYNLKTEAISNMLNNEKVYSIIFDNEKNLWVGTGNGIFCLKDDEVIAHFTTNHGLQDWEFNTNSCARSDDGELFFGGVYGANSFFPQNLVNFNEKYDYHIDGILSSKQSYNRIIENGEIVKYDYGSHQLNIKIKTLSALSPKLFNYQFAIENGEWLDLKTITSISYLFTPGRYRIYYHVAKNFQPLAPKLNYIDIDIEKPIYLYSLFWISLLIAISAAIFYFYRKIYQLELEKTNANLETTKQINLEKNRISRDLHDMIGAQISIISRNLDWIIENIKNLKLEAISKKLEQLNELSHKTNNDLRDTIWVTKKEALDMKEFVNRLQGFAMQLADKTSYITFDNQATHVHLTSYQALNLLRISQEALINAIKYNKATTIEFHACVVNEKLHIDIMDKGQGFDIEKQMGKGNGLINMKERAEHIHFHLYIVSKIGIGTTISIVEK